MEKIINKIIRLLFDGKGKVTYSFTPGTKTVFPKHRVEEEQWLTEYKVSFMHGWRSNPVYID